MSWAFALSVVVFTGQRSNPNPFSATCQTLSRNLVVMTEQWLYNVATASQTSRAPGKGKLF
jgi:hypothetical protein